MITSATASIPSPIRQLVISTRGPSAPLGFLDHAVEIGAHERRQVGFVDHEQIGANHAGPRLRGMSSPPATSMTNIQKSVRSREKVEARLSPPLSSRISSTPESAAPVRRRLRC